MPAYRSSGCPHLTGSPSPAMSNDHPHTPISSPGSDPVVEASPDSPPLRPVSDEEVARLGTPPDIIPKAESERRPGEPRFPPKNAYGEKQCVNCQETDTPQWRGALCNACALWKRSRGTDRPLPLLFPIRKRARSPSPVSDEEEEDEKALHTAYGRSQLPDPSSAQSSPVHPQFLHTGRQIAQYPKPATSACVMCLSRAELAIRGRPFCGPCARSLYAQTQVGRSSIPGPKSAESPHPTVDSTHNRQSSGTHASFYPPNQEASATREKLHLSTAGHHKDLWTPVSSGTRPRFLMAHGSHNPQAVYQTPISPLRSDHGGLRGPRDPRISHLAAASDVGGSGRRRSATVSGNGRLDELAHPSATVHLQLPQMPPTAQPGLPPTSPRHPDYHRVNSPIPSSGVMPTSASKRLRFQLSPSPPPAVPFPVLPVETSARPTARRATVSGSPPHVATRIEPGTVRPYTIDAEPRARQPAMDHRPEVPDDNIEMPSHHAFMRKAEWIWGVLERTNKLLGEVEIHEVP